MLTISIPFPPEYYKEFVVKNRHSLRKVERFQVRSLAEVLFFATNSL